MNSMEQITPFLFLSTEEAKEKTNRLPEKKDLSSLSSFFKMFGDTTRLRILFLLAEGELCVGDLAALMDMTTSAISHQLKLLKSGELVSFRREGKTLFYALADDHVKDMIKIGLEHIKE